MMLSDELHYVLMGQSETGFLYVFTSLRYAAALEGSAKLGNVLDAYH
jgi:hypothetical protein